MADTKTLLEQEAASVRPRTFSHEEIAQIARRRAIRRRVMGGVVGLAAGIVAIAVIATAIVLRPEASTVGHNGQPNYAFEVHGIGVAADTHFPDPSTAVIESTVSWATSEFPGVHRCRARALAEDGALVGEATFRVMAMSGSHPTRTKVEVTGPPVSAEITCDPDRLDFGEPYEYEFRDPRVDGAAGTIEANVTWLGPAASGVVSCAVTVTGPDGNLVAAHSMNSYAAQPPAALAIHLQPDEVFDDTFYDADPSELDVRFYCRPFDGSPPPAVPSHTPRSVTAPDGVTVAVFNATPKDGLATSLAARLTGLGYQVIETGNFPPSDRTGVYFHTDREGAESLAERVLPGALIAPYPSDAIDIAADLVVVLGTDSVRADPSPS